MSGTKSLFKEDMNREVTWENCVDLCRSSQNIVVSGCQRSGTTYGAEALAKALGYRHHDEHDFGVSDVIRFKRLLIQDYPKVIQAPAILHALRPYEQGCIIVIMTRDENEVAASMLKHRWYDNHGREEFSKFSVEIPSSPQEIYRKKIAFSKTLKAVELPYRELNKTEGFIKDRSGWHIKQTKN